MSILKEAIKKQKSDFYLRNTTYLMHIPEQAFRKELTDLYNREELVCRVLASILNGVYTDGKPTFFISQRSLDRLFTADKNLFYKGRKGVKTTEYRQAYAELFKWFNDSESFTIIEDPSKEHKTPACVALIDESTLLAMGDQITIKLASNWHQMAIKQLSNMRKCHENAEQFQNGSHDNINVKVNKKNSDNSANPTSLEEDGIEINLSMDSCPILGTHPLPNKTKTTTELKSQTDVTADAILAKWKPVKIDKNELENILSDLFATMKYYSISKDELSTKKILKAMFGPSPSKKIDWLVEKAEATIDGQRELAYAPELSIKSAPPEVPSGKVSGVLRERDFDVPGAYALYYDSMVNGREIHSLGGSIVEYYNSRAYSAQFKDITQKVWRE